MSDASQGTLEAPVSSSLGAMGSLLKKLSLLLAPNYPLWRSLKHAIKLLEEDLEEIRVALMEQSMVDYNRNKVKYWMEEVRELLYDIEDSIDIMMFSHTAAYATSRSIHGHSHGFFLGHAGELQISILRIKAIGKGLPVLGFIGFPIYSSCQRGSQKFQSSGLCCGRRANGTKGTSLMVVSRIQRFCPTYVVVGSLFLIKLFTT